MESKTTDKESVPNFREYRAVPWLYDIMLEKGPNAAKCVLWLLAQEDSSLMKYLHESYKLTRNGKELVVEPVSDKDGRRIILG